MRKETARGLCEQCGRNNATHMCNDCGEVLCLDCLETRTSEYIVCPECHSNLGTFDGDEELNECPECECKNLSKGKRIEEICPKCHSTRTICIEDKRRDLSQTLRHSINDLQYGHLKLREFSNKLSSSKRLLISLRMANFAHYYWLEEKAEELQSEVAAIKNRIVNQAEIVARRLAAETKGIMNSEDWVTEQFPFIEGVTHRVKELVEHYKANVDDSLFSVFSELSELTESLEGLDYYRKQFAEFYQYAELSVNELPVCALPEIKITGSDFLKHDKASGILFITNKRLIFIAETGTFRKKMDVIFDFPLLYLNSIEEDGRIRKRLVFRLKQGDLKISADDHTEKILVDYIEIAKRFERYMQTDLQKVRKLEQSNLSMSDARMKIEDLVQSLLSPKGRSASYSRYDSGEAPYLRRGGMSPPLSGQRNYVPNDRPFVDSLERSLNQRLRDQAYEYNPVDSQEVRRIKRDIMDLQEAIDNTISLFRNRRLVPEDFIRRYKDLMRDSYQTRKLFESMVSSDDRKRW